MKDKQNVSSVENVSMYIATAAETGDINEERWLKYFIESMEKLKHGVRSIEKSDDLP